MIGKLLIIAARDKVYRVTDHAEVGGAHIINIRVGHVKTAPVLSIVVVRQGLIEQRLRCAVLTLPHHSMKLAQLVIILLEFHLLTVQKLGHIKESQILTIEEHLYMMPPDIVACLGLLVSKIRLVTEFCPQSVSGFVPNSYHIDGTCIQAPVVIVAQAEKRHVHLCSDRVDKLDVIIVLVHTIGAGPLDACVILQGLMSIRQNHLHLAISIFTIEFAIKPHHRQVGETQRRVDGLAIVQIFHWITGGSVHQGQVHMVGNLLTIDHQPRHVLHGDHRSGIWLSEY